MTSPDAALNRGRTPDLESYVSIDSAVTFEEGLSHGELTSWQTSLGRETGGGRSLAIYGELRLREVLLLADGAPGAPHATVAAVAADLLLKLTTLFVRRAVCFRRESRPRPRDVDMFRGDESRRRRGRDVDIP